ncbi:hypothetical protein MASR2M66_08370 [Chloroflexota bacterium]
MGILFQMTDSESSRKIKLLKQAFNGLTDAELETMAALTDLRTYPAGHVLCQEGSYEEIFYIITSGNAAISKSISAEEGGRVLRDVGPGDLVGEMALIQNAPRAATVCTTSECTVLEMDKLDFETMLQRNPSVALDIVRITLNRLRENDQAMIADLQKTNQVLRQLDRNKLEFIQVAAHELRTPMTVLKGYANLLHTTPELQSDPALSALVDGILKGTERMHSVVNTMLDVTRIDSERQELRFTPILLKQMIGNILGKLKTPASERTIELNYFQEVDPPLMYGDPELLTKALYHLIVNAIKYTPDGGKVTVSTHPAQMENEAPGVLISVQDTGIGLDAEHHKLVFEKFYQTGDAAIHSSGTTTFKGGGPGLGLAIVRGVARAHGGEAWVESVGNDEVNFPGSTFFLLLPVGHVI